MEKEQNTVVTAVFSIRNPQSELRNGAFRNPNFAMDWFRSL
jgi:hypothetical protein